MLHVLLVREHDDDEMRLASEYLSSCGLTISQSDGNGSAFDAVVIAMPLRPSPSFELLRDRRSGTNRPIIVIANETVDCLVAFELGADDFMIRPIDNRLLLARLHLAVRRSSTNGNGSAKVSDSEVVLPCFKVGDLEVDIDSRRVYRSGIEVAITPVEFEILKHLVKCPGKLVARENLSSFVFGRAKKKDRAIDVHISSLRRKLGAIAPGGAQRIRTVRGYGYVYSNDPLTSNKVNGNRASST